MHLVGMYGVLMIIGRMDLLDLEDRPPLAM